MTGAASPVTHTHTHTHCAQRTAYPQIILMYIMHAGSVYVVMHKAVDDVGDPDGFGSHSYGYAVAAQ